MTDGPPDRASAPRRRRRLPSARGLLPLVLQCLPLLGLSGCAVLWSALPVNTLVRQGSPATFWSFMGAAGLGALAAVCWGFGYFYLARRERLGCIAATVGPLFVLWSVGYAFGGFELTNSDADEAGRRQAIVNTLLLCSPPVLLMAWDTWRMTRK